MKWEQRFLKLPERKRGFKNSLLEKYVFVNPSVAVPDQSWATGGMMVLLQAHPINKGEHHLRYVIWKPREPLTPGHYEYRAFPESEIRSWFVKAGREISESPVLPPVTPSHWHESQEQLDAKERAFREEMLRSYGYDPHPIRPWITGGLIALISIAVCWAIWRFRSRTST